MGFRFTIGKKILAGFLIVVAAFTGLCAYTFVKLNEIESGYDALLSRSAPLVMEVKDLNFELRTQGYNARGFLLSGQPEYIQRYKESRQRMDKIFVSLDQKLLTPEGKEQIAGTKAAAAKYHQALEQTIEIKTQKGTNESLAYLTTAGTVAQEAETKMTAFVKFLTERMDLRVKENRSVQTQIEILVMILDAVIVLFAIGMAIWLTRKISQPVNLALHAANRIADGDLTVSNMNYRGNDELSDLIDAFNRMQAQLRDLIAQVTAATDHVADSSLNLSEGAEQSAQASTQVADSITQVSMGTDQQVKAVGEAVAVVGAMSENITTAARNADSVSRESKNAANTARTGESTVQKAVSQMGNVQQTVSNSAAVVTELGSRSKEIGQIVETISGIAGQTNLLALNAAIEAARAGEQGRGFAVVAEEVRKLAEQSGDAAKTIADLIAGIQNETERAVLAMNAGKQEVEAGAALVQDAGDAFREIHGMVENVSSQMDSFAGTVQELAAGSSQIIGVIKEIETVSKETASQAQSVSAATEEQSASMEEIAAASQALSDMAQKLQTSVSRFRV